MTKELVIRDRLKAKPAKHLEEAIKEAKSPTSRVKRTLAGIRIKRLGDLTILF